MLRGRSIPQRGWRRSRLAVALIVISVTGATACPLCYEAARQMVTIGQQLDVADQVVLAVPLAGEHQFRMVEVVKGEDAIGDVIDDPVIALGTAAATSSDPFLLVRDSLGPKWIGLGTIPAKHANWLRQLTATFLIKGDHPRPIWPMNMQTSFMLSYDGWRQRIALVLPYLENPDPLVAQIAWGELARAPYAIMDVARSRVDATAVESWLDDPKLASRHAAYALLLGFVGNSANAAQLEQRIEGAWNAHDPTNLAAMIGADLELRGAAQVGWVEAKYFSDHERSMPEIEAALRALDVHGEVNRTVPRARVIQAYRTFIREHPAMAGFVAQQLADWDYWDATPEYMELLKSRAIKDPASEFAVVNYLQRSAAAKAAVQ